MQGHVVPKKTYFLVFITLIALTALTTAVAFKDLVHHPLAVCGVADVALVD